jgi:hypothetical protein
MRNFVSEPLDIEDLNYLWTPQARFAELAATCSGFLVLVAQRKD